jgi:hypothetical protein
LGIFGDIGTFGDTGTGIILAKNREIALIFSAISANSAILPNSAILGRPYRAPCTW